MLGAIGAWILFVVLLRLRLSACNPAHPASSDSRAVETDLVEPWRSGPLTAPASALRSSAALEVNSCAKSRVTVSSPLHGPREIDLSLFTSVVTQSERRQDRDPVIPNSVQRKIHTANSHRSSHRLVRPNV